MTLSNPQYNIHSFADLKSKLKHNAGTEVYSVTKEYPEIRNLPYDKEIRFVINYGKDCKSDEDFAKLFREISEKTGHGITTYKKVFYRNAEDKIIELPAHQEFHSKTNEYKIFKLNNSDRNLIISLNVKNEQTLPMHLDKVTQEALGNIADSLPNIIHALRNHKLPDLEPAVGSRGRNGHPRIKNATENNGIGFGGH